MQVGKDTWGHVVQPATQGISQEANKMSCCCFPDDLSKYQKKLDSYFVI